MTDEQRASKRITDAVTSWPGVVAGPGRRGELSFKVGGREIGHLHGDSVAHFSFPKDVWRSLYDEGRIDYHPVFPGRPGMGARRLEGDLDVDDVIVLMRLNYERVFSRHGLPSPTAA
jgi:Luciferase